MLHTWLAVVAFLTLSALIFISTVSTKVRSKIPQIGLLALFVVYVSIRQLPTVRAYADMLALVFVTILVSFLFTLYGTLSSYRIVEIPRIRKGYLKGKLVAEIPRGMCEDESATITVLFTNSVSPLNGISILRHLVIPVPGTLSVTLQAAGFEVADNQARSQNFVQDARLPYGHFAVFHWNIRPKSSGTFDLNLLAEVSNGEKIIAGYFPAKIRVSKILGLTARQVWILASVFGVITGLASIGSFVLQIFRP